MMIRARPVLLLSHFFISSTTANEGRSLLSPKRPGSSGPRSVQEARDGEDLLGLREEPRGSFRSAWEGGIVFAEDRGWHKPRGLVAPPPPGPFLSELRLAPLVPGGPRRGAWAVAALALPSRLGEKREAGLSSACRRPASEAALAVVKALKVLRRRTLWLHPRT
jgi:hypothetical protein